MKSYLNTMMHPFLPTIIEATLYKLRKTACFILLTPMVKSLRKIQLELTIKNGIVLKMLLLAVESKMLKKEKTQKDVQVEVEIVYLPM